MGRSFWVLDNLTPLHQLSDKVASAPVTLFKPREAIRAIAGGRGGGRGNPAAPQFLPVGAQVDFYLASVPQGEVRLDVLDSAGRVVRSISSAAPTAPVQAVEAAPADDEEGGGGGRGNAPPPRLPKAVGHNRFTWDLRYPGAWQSANRPEGPNGPLAPPGKYTVRLVAGSTTVTQPLTVLPDPRDARDGVSVADLRTQFAHNIRVRDLVSDANQIGRAHV